MGCAPELATTAPAGASPSVGYHAAVNVPRWAWLCGLLPLTAGCGSEHAASPVARQLPPSSAAPAVAPPAPAQRAGGVKLGPPRAIITEPETLVALEAGGFTLGARAFGASARGASELAKLPRYQQMVDVLEEDLREIQRSDHAAGVGMQKPHRLFDARWLTAASARFELVGVVNRVDRDPFDQSADRCGEARLIYRLAYRTEAGGNIVDSRLPMTINVVTWQEGDCADVVQRWRAPAEIHGAELAAWLRTSGPFSRPGSLKSVEVNFQSVRWPSAVHPSMAGHAEYLLRVFVPEGEQLVPGPLENQPDWMRIRRSPKLKAELSQWIRDNLTAIDAGTATLPEHLLAKRAQSVAPRGLARLANRPFRAVVRPGDFEATSLSGFARFSDPEALIRRLDGMSCSGCHQSRSMAGFHLLGEERRSDKVVDALALAVSPHLQEDLTHRRAAITSLLVGGDGKRPRLTSERTAKGNWGAHCGLTPAAFAEWTCEPGLSCQPVLGEALVGMCLDDERLQVGAPCETGTVTQKRDPHQDRVGNVTRRTCEAGVCERNRVGFPAGMCATGCSDDRAETTCGAIALLTDFNDCLAQGRPFEGCIVNNSRPAGLRRCGAEARCRDDYVCAKTASGEGACMPPYFLFQLRVDGHPR